MSYTSKEIAEVLDISHSTVRNWGRKFDIPRENKIGKGWIYDEEARRIFETIKSLRSDDCGYDTITRRLAPDNHECQSDSHDNQSDTHDNHPIIKSLANEFQTVMKTELSAANQLAEKYARATYEIGELKAENKFLLSEIERLKSEKKGFFSKLIGIFKE